MANEPRFTSKKSRSSAKSRELSHYILSDLKIGRVDLVPAGANRKWFVLRKEHLGEDMPIDVSAILDTKLDSEDLRKALHGLDEDKVAAAELIAKTLQAFEGELPVEALAQFGGAKIEKGSAMTAEQMAEYSALKKAAAQADQDKKDKMAKENRDPKVEAVRKEYDEKIAELQARIEKEQLARLEKEWIERAKTYTIPTLPADKLGPMLCEAHTKMAKEHVEALHQAFAAITDSVNKSDDFETVGKSSRGESHAFVSASAEIEKQAAELRKADASITEAQALVKAIQANPDLYARQMADRYSK